MKLLYLTIIVLLVNNGTCYVDKINNVLYSRNYSDGSVFTPVVNELIIPLIEHAAEICQEVFQWDVWNCQESDFGEKLFSKSLDRETLNVQTLVQAVMAYEISVACFYDVIPGCSNEVSKPSPDPTFAYHVIETLFAELLEEDGTAHPIIRKHNMDVLKLLFTYHTYNYCECRNKENVCQNWVCADRIKPFSDVLLDITHTLHGAIQVDITVLPEILVSSKNSTLIYLDKSRDYCETDNDIQWTGVKGRECPPKYGEPHWEGCNTLCKSCDLEVVYIESMNQRPCNCFHTVCCGVKCDKCLFLEKTLSCN